MIYSNFKAFYFISIYFFGQIFLGHFVWATQDEIPRLDSEIQRFCKDEKDLHYARALAVNLSQCQFKDLKKGFPPEKQYFVYMNRLVGDFVSIQAKMCRDRFHPLIRKTLHENVIQGFERLSSGKESSLFEAEGIKIAFRHLAFWMRQTRETIYSQHSRYAGFDKPKGILQQDLSQVLSAFWQKVWEISGSAQNVTQQHQSFTQGLGILSQSVETALSEKIPSDAFFPILEGVLSQFSKRVELFMELALSTAELSESGSQHGSGFEMDGLSQVLLEWDRVQPSVQKVSSVLSQMSHPEIQRFLEVMIQGAQRNAELVSSSGVSNARISGLPLTGVPVYARGYVYGVSSLAALADSYQRAVGQEVHGTESGAQRLSFGLTKEKIEKVPDQILKIQRNLEESKNKFENLREKVAHQLSHQLSQEAQKRQLQDQGRDDWQEIQELSSDLNGLKAHLMDRDALEAQRLRSFFNLTQSSQWKDQEIFKTVASQRVELSGSSARFNPDQRWVSIPELSHVKIEAQAGQSLVLSVSGSWSPSGALKREGLPWGAKTGPEGFLLTDNQGKIQVQSVSETLSTRQFDTSQVLSGKDLRTYQEKGRVQSDQVSTAHQNSHTDTTTIASGSRDTHDRSFVDDQRANVSSGFSIGICEGLSFSTSCSKTIPGNIITNSHSSYQSRDHAVSDSQTTTHSRQHMSSDETKSGTQTAEYANDQKLEGTEGSSSSAQVSSRSDEKRSSASFSLGYLSAWTPFSDLPMGSLLLVQLPKGATRWSEVQDVEVVRSNFVKLVHQDSDFYLVVNDCIGGEVFADDRLSIFYEIQEPRHRHSRSLMNKMGDVFRSLTEKSESYLRTGDLTAVQMRGLESFAQQKIAEGGDHLQEAPLMRDLFESWVLSELVQLELKIKILQAERRLRPVVHRVRRLERDLKGLLAQQEISKLTQIWALSNRDLMGLSQDLHAAVHELRHTVLPILQVRYPEVFRGMQVEHARFMEVLRLETPVEKMNSEFQKFLRDLAVKVQTLATEMRQETTYIALRFPKVEATDISGVPCMDDNGSCALASPLASLAVWDAIRAASIPVENLESSSDILRNFQDSLAVLEVKPEDIYVKSGDFDWVNQRWARRPVDAGALSDWQSSPLVESMGIYFNVQSLGYESINQFNDRQIRQEIHLVSDVTVPFPSLNQSRNYQLTGDWRRFHVPLFVGSDLNCIGAFEKGHWESQKFCHGISPFGKFELDLRKLNLDKNRISGLGKYTEDLSDLILVMKVNYRVMSKNSIEMRR